MISMSINSEHTGQVRRHLVLYIRSMQGLGNPAEGDRKVTWIPC